ncbi:CLUMA_CG009287, isoform A [Clunio marinus]|uniref:CLUMA_CG009287, isoform A n=1 Tax=Clunio marinus TaxID=568069 RepID=A0A1J1IA52_9DIPT|nr:CLUMA_CG009287, isoform A [Clunio marinus]
MALKYLIAFQIIAALIGLSNALVNTRFVDLRVDHFNPLDRRTYDGRYFVNSEHWISGGVIFLYVSGGFELYDDFLTRGVMYELAEETRGMIVSLEHRYYGTSRPTEDTSVANLQWLNAHQALADIAQFVEFIRANYYGAENARVIAFGRGYGGTLAAWARQKYPSAVDAVWASSAYINGVLEYPQFMTNTFNTINSIGGPECGSILEDAFRMIEDEIRAGDTSYTEERLRLCSPIDIHDNEAIARLFYGIAADIGFAFVSNARYPEIDDKCTLMRGLNTPENLPENAIDAFARWFADDFNRNLECLNYENSAVLGMYQQVEWNTVSTIAGRRQNLWLQCSQLGQFAVANEGENHPFGWRFDRNFFIQWCAQVFEEANFSESVMEELIGRTNEYFGGFNPHIYRVFFTHGEMDPRRSLGPSEDLNPNAPVVVMSLQSAGRDFGPTAEADYVVLQQTKARARALMTEWIFDALEEERPPPVSPLSV